MDISRERLDKFLHCYGFSYEEFDQFTSGARPIPVVSVRDECISLLGRMDENKLRAVYAMLTSFTY